MSTLNRNFEPVTPNKVESMQSSIMTHTKLKQLFDALNKNFFSGHFKLNGDIKWSDYLKSRTAAALIGSTSTGVSKIFIRMSKTLLGKCTRKQLIESLMYEMILAFVHKEFADNDKDADSFEAVLAKAMDDVNATTGMQITFNHPFTAHKTIEPCSQWVNVDGSVAVLENNNTIVCISDDEFDELDEPNHLVDIRRNDCTKIRFISNKIHLSDRSNDLLYQIRVKIMCFMCFIGTNFPLNSNQAAKCPLCCQNVDVKALNVHFNDCVVLRN